MSFSCNLVNNLKASEAKFYYYQKSGLNTKAISLMPVLPTWWDMFGTLRYSAIAEKGTVNPFQEKDTLCVVTEYVKEDPNAGPEGRQWKKNVWIELNKERYSTKEV